MKHFLWTWLSFSFYFTDGEIQHNLLQVTKLVNGRTRIWTQGGLAWSTFRAYTSLPGRIPIPGGFHGGPYSILAATEWSDFINIDRPVNI